MQTCHIQLQMGYSLWQDRMNTSVLSEVFSSGVLALNVMTG